MGTLGLALPWKARITAPGEAGRRVASSEIDSLDEQALAALCRGGDLRGYERLYALYGPRMLNLARNVVGGTADAEDAVQETFLKIHRSILSFRGQSSFRTWVFRVLINTCYDARRSRLRKREVTEDETAAHPERRAPGAHPALALALERALAQLSRHQREVFLLYEVEGFHHAEIAGMLETTETASKNTLFQAKKNLRRMLEPPQSPDGAR